MMRTSAILVIAAVACAGETGPVPPPVGTGPIEDRLTARIAALESDLIGFRRDLHRHPELSGQEQRTAAAVASRLRALGLDVRTSVGGHGVVALVRGGKAGPLVAYRADMDAVPSTAPDPVPFPSLAPGIRHICGHDVHTTIGVALAEALAAVRADLPGTVMLVFQPAEERATGAKAMLAAGVFSQLPVAIFGVHTAPLEVGRLGSAPGPLMASRDFVTITASGPGDRPAALAAARTVVEQVGTVVDPFAPATGDFILVQFGASSSTTLSATLSLVSAAARATARATIRDGVAAIAVPSVTLAVDYQERAIAGVTNDTALTAATSAAIAGRLGAESVVGITTIVPAFSEDFGSFQERVPGVFYFLGVSNSARGTIGYPHRADYVADEGAIQVGAKAMAAAILARLQAGS